MHMDKFIILVWQTNIVALICSGKVNDLVSICKVLNPVKNSYYSITLSFFNSFVVISLVDHKT